MNREDIFKKIDDLDNVIHILEATANTYYNPNDKMWNHLLRARDSMQKHIDKEKQLLYKEVDTIDALHEKGEVEK
jgi:hypothetical protein